MILFNKRCDGEAARMRGFLSTVWMILFNKRCDGEAARMRGFLSTVWYFTEVWTS